MRRFKSCTTFQFETLDKQDCCNRTCLGHSCFNWNTSAAFAASYLFPATLHYNSRFLFKEMSRRSWRSKLSSKAQDTAAGVFAKVDEPLALASEGTCLWTVRDSWGWTGYCYPFKLVMEHAQLAQWLINLAGLLVTVAGLVWDLCAYCFHVGWPGKQGRKEKGEMKEGSKMTE